MDSDAVKIDSPAAAAGYEAPTIMRLGTLTDLTLGGWAGIPDGIGGAPGEGSFVF
jgi:hypothetical protein